MILPILTQEHPTLRFKTVDIMENYPNLNTLITDMKETMRAANGIGLAASQIGEPINLFVSCLCDYIPGFPEVFINTKIIQMVGETVIENEECLSLPGIKGKVARADIIQIEYFDENFKKMNEYHHSYIARVIQHEYDHTQGILFIDKLITKKG